MANMMQVLLAALIVTVPAKGRQGTQSFSGEYSISYLGLPIAYSRFNSTFDGNAYSVKGAFTASALARIFEDTRGSISSSGRISGGKVQPVRFHAAYTYGRKATTIDMRFAGGKLVSTKVTPPPKKKKSDDWVPVRANDLRGVADPLAATVVSADSLDDVCNRSVKFYDSELRANLTLTQESKGSISVEGYEGPTVTCRLRFEPVAGYHSDRRSMKFLRDKSRMMVTFAPLGKTGVYAPVYATVGTEYGTVTVKAHKFEAKQ